MDILFIGCIFNKEQENEILKKNKGPIQFAANILQSNLIRGLNACNDRPISILNSIVVGTYPRFYPDCYIKSLDWVHVDGAKVHNVGFITIFGIKHIWRAIGLGEKAIKWAKASSTNKKAIVVSSMHTPFVFAAAMAKIANPNIHVCLIVTDLPEFMDLREGKSGIVMVLKKLDILFMNIFMKYIDSFTCLTKYMPEALGIGERPWIVMEGVVNPDDFIQAISSRKKENTKIILYAGTLVKKYGIMQLLEAFSAISDPSYRLWICGEGEARHDIVRQAEIDTRICYFGQVNRDEVLKLMQEATVLINPRGNEEDFTKYSFPSKIMEYLLSGKPTIVRKLPGIPKKYFDYLFVVEENTSQALADKIIEVCSINKEELNAFGERARHFVVSNKNYIKQARRIYQLISGEACPEIGQSCEVEDTKSRKEEVRAR